MEIENIGSISSTTPLTSAPATNSTAQENESSDQAKSEYIGTQVDILA
jgi:hypothetical protein